MIEQYFRPGLPNVTQNVTRPRPTSLQRRPGRPRDRVPLPGERALRVRKEPGAHVPCASVPPPPWKLPLRLRRSEPLNFGLFPRAVDKSPQTGIELSAEEDEEESGAFWCYPPVSTPCTELFRDPA